ncbi:MAG: hypothetical protein PHH65_05015 [Eubacteriales bacterium]|jgi:hypothetical protein|nr:hypothetical protein [Eubacteriales bacterium]
MTTIFARLIAVAVKNPAAVRTSQVINRLSIQPVTVGAPPRMAALIAAEYLWLAIWRLLQTPIALFTMFFVSFVLRIIGSVVH